MSLGQTVTDTGEGFYVIIRDDINFNRLENISEQIENIFVDILLPNTRQILVGIVYRPPDQSGFLDKLSDAVSNISDFNTKEVYILGDL